MISQTKHFSKPFCLQEKKRRILSTRKRENYCQRIQLRFMTTPSHKSEKTEFDEKTFGFYSGHRVRVGVPGTEFHFLKYVISTHQSKFSERHFCFLPSILWLVALISICPWFWDTIFQTWRSIISFQLFLCVFVENILRQCKNIFKVNKTTAYLINGMFYLWFFPVHIVREN